LRRPGTQLHAQGAFARYSTQGGNAECDDGDTGKNVAVEKANYPKGAGAGGFDAILLFCAECMISVSVLYFRL
jgi:hypothetical protein